MFAYFTESTIVPVGGRHWPEINERTERCVFCFLLFLQFYAGGVLVPWGRRLVND